ncbi:MAG: fimbrillin family protein, partial [Mucinivorans sp.]
MRKILIAIVAGLVAATWVGCSKGSSDIIPGEVPIVLTPVFEEQSNSNSNQSSSTSSASRAVATAFEEGDQIGLFALAKGAALMASGNAVNNALFVKASDGAIKATPAAYYPNSTDAVPLYAYYPRQTSVADALAMSFAVITDQSASSIVGAMSKTNLSLSDLCYAMQSVTPSASIGAAALTFSHKLSHIIYSVTVPSAASGSGSASSVQIKSVKLIDAATKA